MLFDRAALPLSFQTLSFTAGVIRRHRKSIGSCWRKLTPGQQALLVLVYLKEGETFAEVAAGFGVGAATAWRYVKVYKTCPYTLRVLLEALEDAPLRNRAGDHRSSRS